MTSMEKLREVAGKLADTLQPHIDLEVEPGGPRFTFLAELMATVLNRELESMEASEGDRRGCVNYIRHRVMLHTEEFPNCKQCRSNGG